MQLRKLIAHGPSSLTLALPHKWIKRQELSKGDVVSVIEDQQGLHIQSKPTEQRKNLSLSIAGHDAPGIMTVLTTVYRRGYDEVIVQYGTPEEY